MIQIKKKDDVCNTNNRRSLISALVPRAAFGNKLPILVPDSDAPSEVLIYLVANMNIAQRGQG